MTVGELLAGSTPFPDALKVVLIPDGGGDAHELNDIVYYNADHGVAIVLAHLNDSADGDQWDISIGRDQLQGLPQGALVTVSIDGLGQEVFPATGGGVEAGVGVVFYDPTTPLGNMDEVIRP